MAAATVMPAAHFSCLPLYFFSSLPKRGVLKHTHTIYWHEGIFSAHLKRSGWVNGRVKPRTVQNNLNAAARVWLAEVVLKEAMVTFKAIRNCAAFTCPLGLHMKRSSLHGQKFFFSLSFIALMAIEFPAFLNVLAF